MKFLRRNVPAVETVEPGPVAPTPVSGTNPCDEASCARTDASRCSYVDRRLEQCPTHWCPAHQAVDAGLPYCRRHATIAAALRAGDATAQDAPDLGNRAPSLCIWMSLQLNPTARAIMGQCQATHPGSNVDAGPLELVIIGSPRRPSWEYKWQLSSHMGRITTIAVRVTEAEDSTVLVLVDGGTVAAGVPPWITQRMADSDEDDRVRRLGFNQYFMAAAAAELRRLGHLPASP